MDSRIEKAIVEQLQQELKQSNIEHFYIIACEWGNTLVLAGSFDFSYYHNVEITFDEVQFILCPGSIFNVEIIRLATEEEIQQLYLVMYGYERNAIVYCLENEFEQQKFYIVAKQMKYTFGMVYYYDRPNLQPGERIADHVHKGRLNSDNNE
ncbi:hypothetical protein [Paenibacillus xylanexedens]|uniref:hypothetical protein n=1 Tax=Paenibacillus xylanexedens TaxID=528191 RepID=UPI0011A458A1|nr:hypothetical protein [Paenibacillus xylanexedens]